MDFPVKIPVLSLVNKIFFLKNATRILLSLLVFSFLISLSLLLHLFLSTFSSKLFSFSTERNYIFLLCNGVILVIIKTSGLSAPGMERSGNKNDKRNTHDEAFRNKDNENDIPEEACRNKDDDENVEKSCNKSFTSKIALLVETKTEITNTIEKDNDMTGVESDHNVTLTAHYGVKSEGDELRKTVKELEEQQIFNIRECEEEGLLSLEELNKKCEDFIRKMKHDITFEDRQLIMV